MNMRRNQGSFRSVNTRVPKATRGKQRTLDNLIEDGEKYSQTSGVELKFDGDDRGVNWESTVSLNDTLEIVKRCMAKYPSVVPSELTLRKAEVLLKVLPGLDKSEKLTRERFDAIITEWEVAYKENLDKVMFDNLSSYEP